MRAFKYASMRTRGSSYSGSTDYGSLVDFILGSSFQCVRLMISSSASPNGLGVKNQTWIADALRWRTRSVASSNATTQQIRVSLGLQTNGILDDYAAFGLRL